MFLALTPLTVTYKSKTLTFKSWNIILTFIVQNFSGHKNLQPSRRPPAYPSQHTSHFSIGILPGHDLDTHSRKTFVKHHTSPVSSNKVIGYIKLNKIKWRWKFHVCAAEPLKSCSPIINSPSQNHSTLKSLSQNISPTPLPPKEL